MYLPSSVKYVLFLFIISFCHVVLCQDDYEDNKGYAKFYSPEEADVAPFPIADEESADMKGFSRAGWPRERVEAYVVRYPNHKYYDDSSQNRHKLGDTIYVDEVIKSPQAPIQGWVEVVDSEPQTRKQVTLDINDTTSTEPQVLKVEEYKMNNISGLTIEEHYDVGNATKKIADSKSVKPFFILNKDKKIRVTSKATIALENSKRKTLHDLKKYKNADTNKTNTNSTFARKKAGKKLPKNKKEKAATSEEKLKQSTIQEEEESSIENEDTSEYDAPITAEEDDPLNEKTTKKSVKVNKKQAIKKEVNTANKKTNNQNAEKSLKPEEQAEENDPKPVGKTRNKGHKRSMKDKKRGTSPSSEGPEKIIDVEDMLVEASQHNAKYSEQGGGKKLEEKHHAEGQANSGHGHESSHHEDKGAKGATEKEVHRKEWEEADGKKRRHHDVAGHSGHHEEEAHGHKGAKFNEKKGHKKGHKTKGYHNKYHKDEYHKEHKFYDDYHKGGSHHRYGKFHAKHQTNENGHKKAHHIKAGHDTKNRGKKGYHHKGHTDADHKGHDSKKGHDQHHHHASNHAKKGGKAGGSHYTFHKKE